MFYPIVDTAVCRAHDFDPRAVAEACFRGGARWLQIRHKQDPGSARLRLPHGRTRQVSASARAEISELRRDLAGAERGADAAFGEGGTARRLAEARLQQEAREGGRNPGSARGSGELLQLADDIVRIAARFGAQVIVNDRADICRMAECAGVHVGQEDLPVEEVRRILGPDAIVGLSTHDREQIDIALSSAATYVAVGPIYTTSTKDTGYAARGLELVAYAADRGKPVVAIGGITLERAADVLRAGASAVAVITDVLTGGDPEARTRAFLDLA